MKRLAMLAATALIAVSPAAWAADKPYLPLKPEAYAVPAAGIDEARFVTIGGLDQWVVIRGQDRTNPVLLIMPGPGGGPGQSGTQLIQPFLPLEKHFTLVHWDPRGTGRTYAKAGQTVGPELTMDRLVQDALELTDLVRQRLGKQKIALLGSAYGSTLGLKMIRARPDRFSVFVGQSFMANTSAERERYFYDRLVQQTTAAKDEAGLKDLAYSGWDLWGEKRDDQKIAALMRVYRKYRPPIANYLGFPLHWTADDLKAGRAGAIMADDRLLPEWKVYDFASLGNEFAVPIVILQGEEDRFGPTPFARAWFDKIKAPKKAFGVVPEGGNHFMETHQEEFLALLLQHVRPLAVAP